MAEPPETEPIPSSSDNTTVLTNVPVEVKAEEGPTPEKRRKIDDSDQEKLENRLGGILCCAVCLDLPPAAVYQCTNGHLMCAPCFTHLLADARLRDEAATCPNCRVEISKTSASRNLAVEKTISELPSECKFCTCVFPRHSLHHHEENKCEERQFKFTQIVIDTKPQSRFPLSLVRIITSVYWLLLSALRRTYLVSEVVEAPKRRKYLRLTGCRFACIGCPWRGPWHEAAAHAACCAHPRRSAAELLPTLAERDRRAADSAALHSQLLDLLSYEKITFNDLQLKPYRTEEFVHKLYYESSRFSAFGHQWVVKAFVNNNQRDPTQSSERELSYQVILKSKVSSDVALQWVALRGPWGEAALRPCVQHHAFSEPAPAAPPAPLPLLHRHDTNRLLANRAIHLRLIMFLASK